VSWKTARRVVAKVEFHFGELFPRAGFIVTNLKTDSRAVVRFYSKRGTAEQWIEEGKRAVKMTRLSCHLFRSNEVRLLLSLIAYNLGNLWRWVPSGPGAAEAARRVILDQLAAAVSEDRRAFDPARPVLLAASGGEPPDAAVVRDHGAPDRSAAGAHRIGRGREANRAQG
jgi:Transposase DDE domain group 1